MYDPKNLIYVVFSLICFIVSIILGLWICPSKFTIKIYSPCPKFSNTIIECGDNVNITIGSSKHRIFNSIFSVLSENASLYIGIHASIRGATIIIKENKNLSVDIGNDCLIASNV